MYTCDSSDAGRFVAARLSHTLSPIFHTAHLPHTSSPHICRTRRSTNLLPIHLRHQHHLVNSLPNSNVANDSIVLFSCFPVCQTHGVLRSLFCFNDSIVLCFQLYDMTDNSTAGPSSTDPMDTIPPPTTPQSNPPPLHWFFSLPIAEVIRLSNSELRIILSQAPLNFHPADTDTTRDLVAKAATFHATHDPTTVAKSGEEAWKALKGLTNKEIINLAAHDVPAFTARLRGIVAYRLNLPQTEYDDLGGLTSLAIEWVSQSIDAPTNTGTTQAVVPATPPLERSYDQTFADRDFPFLNMTQSHRPRAIRTLIALNNLS